MSICVIYNPHAGRRRAQRQIGRIRQRYGQIAEFRPTNASGHAEQLARQAAEEGFEIVGAAGGDGTVHEVANGLLQASRTPTLAVLPVGSANDFAYSIGRQFGTSRLESGPVHAVDVGQVTFNGRSRFFVEGLGLGLAGRVTVASRSIRWLRGVALYGLAAWRALNTAAPEDLILQWDDERPVTLPTLILSVLLGQREGAFLLAPGALVDDGWFDVVHGGRISRWGAMRMIPGLVFSGPPANHPEVRVRKCRRLGIQAQRPLTAHVDGEVLCTESDDIRELQITLLPGRLKTLVVADA